MTGGSPAVVAPALVPLLPWIAYVPKRVAHHAQHSGYDVLFSACGFREARSALFARLSHWIPDGLAWRLWLLRPQPSQRSGLEAEIAAIPWVAGGRGRLCHFIYGEDTFLFTPLWKRSANRCVATVHYPPKVLAQRVNPGSLRALDAVIIVGENQRAWLEGIVAPEKIHFCPHHVDTDFFCPALAPAPIPSGTARRLVCVGHLFRDYGCMLEVLRLLRTTYRHDVELDLIGPPKDSTHPLLSEPGVQVLRGISDEALRDTYRHASVGVLPLTDSTANNALVEMMACGLAVVSTDVGGVGNYAQGPGARLLPIGDSAAMAATVDQLLRDAGLRQQCGQDNRSTAVASFSIGACSERLASIYRQVMAR